MLNLSTVIMKSVKMKIGYAGEISSKTKAPGSLPEGHFSHIDTARKRAVISGFAALRGGGRMAG
jgi:hypothetical protein